MKNTLYSTADNYFDDLAKKFPVLCASDEFHFFPRAENARLYYDRLDSLEPKAIEELIGTTKEYQKEFSRLQSQETDLEKQIDLALLQSSASAILIEFEQNQSWRHNPLLYLKIAFIGLDHALTKPFGEQKERTDRVLSRLNLIPRLLHQAVNNLDRVATNYHQAAISMIKDCNVYLHEMFDMLSFPIVQDQFNNLEKGMESALEALEQFQRFLQSISPVAESQSPAASIQTTLKKHFLYERSLDEIFEIGQQEWHENLERLKKTASKIDSQKTWQELYHEYMPDDIDSQNIVELYQKETEQLTAFFGSAGFDLDRQIAPMERRETPAYLLSVRSSASFAAALTADSREISFFYISPHLPHSGSAEEQALFVRRLSREYKFLIAHETVPGHHLLDTVRRNLKNPVRRQIESPLFYEGWAAYAESLLTEHGYIKHPLEKLVELKRNLWRAARCQIDAGLPTGKLKKPDAAKLLTIAGFSEKEAARQLNRFRLNPGYQLCYCLGQYEIKQIKKELAPVIGSGLFHNFLLKGGEIPFHFIRARWEIIEKRAQQ